jgi:branched-chain amino acid transport system substrate-binding protein
MERRRMPLRGTGAAVLLLALVFGVVTQTSSAGAASGLKASAPGVTPTTITVGVISELTGSGASGAGGIPAAFRARIDLQNAQGGVDGRKIEVISEDDQSEPSENETAAAALVEKNVFAINDNSAFAYGAAQYLQQQGIPVVGGGYDGFEWTEPSYTNMFSTAYGVFGGTIQPRYAVNPTLPKKAGAKKFAVLGYSISPSSSGAAANEAISLKQAGFQVPYLDTSLPFGTVNVTAVALQMKAAGVDSMVAEIDGNTELALITAGQQTGIKWKYVVLATGYGSSWLSNPSAVASSQKLYFGVLQTPVELHTPGTIAEQAALKKYAGFSGVPDFGWSEGWESAGLMIEGLQVAGKNPTRQSFITNLRKVTSWNDDGLLAVPINFEHTTTPAKTECLWTAQLVGHQFVPTSTKPACSKLVPGT